MTVETKKILDPDIEVVATCVRVPVFIGHSEAVFIETRKPIDADSARQAMQGFPGLVIVDHRAWFQHKALVAIGTLDEVPLAHLKIDQRMTQGASAAIAGNALGFDLNGLGAVDRWCGHPLSPCGRSNARIYFALWGLQVNRLLRRRGPERK